MLDAQDKDVIDCALRFLFRILLTTVSNLLHKRDRRRDWIAETESESAWNVQ